MRYITDSNGYIKELSFGAIITCDGTECTEYTGGVPDGSESLEDWYLAECDKLYRWKIVDGELTLDESAEAPVEVGASDVVTVNVTGDIDNGYTSDKTPAELITAHDEGKMLRCLVNDSCEASLIGIDRDESLPAVWFSVHQAMTVSIIIIGSTTTGESTCSMNSTTLQEAKYVGELSDLDTDDKSSIVAAINEVKNSVGSGSGDTLPSGGTAGQVLTIGSDGSPVWADPTGGSGSSVASAEGVLF